MDFGFDILHRLFSVKKTHFIRASRRDPVVPTGAQKTHLRTKK